MWNVTHWKVLVLAAMGAILTALGSLIQGLILLLK
jgi:hypothetical protein